MLATPVALLLAAAGLPGIPFLPLHQDLLLDADATHETPVQMAIGTAAGNGVNSTTDGNGTSASLKNPTAVSVQDGFAYVATDGAIRKVDLGTDPLTVSTLAGHATLTGCTDATDPIQVRFNQIQDIEAHGDFLYTTAYCHPWYVLRKTSVATGATSTIRTTYTNLGHLTVGPDGMIYTTGGQGVERIDPATGAETSFAWMSGNTWGITSDGTYLWMVWSGSQRTIERIALDGTHTSIISSSNVGLGPLDSDGPYLWGRQTGERLVRYSKTGASVVPMAGVANGYQDGTGTDAWFGSIQGIAVDGANLWIADSSNYRLRKATPSDPLPLDQPSEATTSLGMTVATVVTTAGNSTNATVNGIGEAASFWNPKAVVVSGGYAYVATTGSIRRVDLSTKEVSILAGHATLYDCLDSVNSAQVRFKEITGMATDGYYLYTAGYCNSTTYLIRRTSIATGATSTIANVQFATFLTVGPDGMIYTTGGQGLRRIDPIDGSVSVYKWYSGSAYAITSDQDSLWVAVNTCGNTCIERIRLADGVQTTFAVSDQNGPQGTISHQTLASAGDYLYATRSYPGEAVRIYKKATGDYIDVAGGLTDGYADGQGLAAFFNGISSIYPSGDYVWIVDGGNYRLRKAGQGFPTGETMGTCGFSEFTFTPCSFLADPVNSATGSFYTNETDVALPGIGVPFALRRFYNSVDDTTGPLGRGWTHEYNVSLAQQPNGDRLLRAGDGKRVLFTRQPNGTYWAGPGARGQLVEDGGSFLLTAHSGVEFRFNAQGKLTSKKARNGQGLTFRYDAGGHLDQITDSVGRQVAFAYDGDLLTSVSLPDGRDVSYGYTGGLLTAVTDLRSKVTTYGYDAGQRLTRIVDSNGNTVVRNSYGPDGRVTEQFDPLGNRSTFSWHPATGTATMTDARGKEWKDVYEDTKLLRRIDPLGNTTRFRYSGVHLTGLTDPRGKAWSMTYDARGNLLSGTAPAPLSHTESFTYDSKNNVTSATDGRGNTTTYAYDAAGSLTKVTAPGSTVTTFGRNAVGQLTSLTDPRGKTTTFGYDADGNLTEVVTPLGHTTTMGYDSSGRMTSRVEPRGNAAGATPADYRWTYAYDHVGHPTTVNDPLGNATSFSYDDAGNLAARTDAKNRRTVFSYNAANELTRVTAPDTTTTSYAYDESGHLASRTDANGHTTTYRYDDAGRLFEVADPLGSPWTYAYDPAGNLTGVTTALGNATPAPGDGEIAYSYDAASRLTGIDYSDATPDVSFAYDANGNLVRMADAAGTETRTYDSLDRLTGVTRGSDSFSYAYDSGGNLIRRTYPDGTVVDLTYDDDSRMASVTSGGASTTYAYDAAGHLTSTTFSNGTSETHAYDRAGRLTTVAHSGGVGASSSFAYILDEVGNPTQITTLEGTTAYAYDAMDRLTTVCFAAPCPSGPDISYAYDAVGNRTSETRPAGSTAYAYNAGDQLTSATGSLGTTSYTYDANGNQTASGARSFAYDLANRMVSTTGGGATTTYAYDGVGKRLSRTADSEVTTYVWDPNYSLPELATERDGAGSLLRRYVQADRPVFMATGGQRYFYQHDALGSVVGLTSETGARVASYRYEPYGTERPSPGGGIPLSPPIGGTPIENRVRFTGEYLDDNSGLYHLRAREYDPSTGRLLATDPLPPPAPQPYVSAYAYVNNRPTVMADPSGLRGQSCGTNWIGMLCDLGHNPVASWQAGWGGSCSQPGYTDLNITTGFFNVGGYADGCGQWHPYFGWGIGLPGASVTKSPATVSCEARSVQAFFPPGPGGSVGSAGEGYTGQSDLFVEGGAGTPGIGYQENLTLTCAELK